MRLTSGGGSMLKNTSGTALRAARSSRCACPAPRARSSRLKSMSPAHARSSSPRSAAEAAVQTPSLATGHPKIRLAPAACSAWGIIEKYGSRPSSGRRPASLRLWPEFGPNLRIADGQPIKRKRLRAGRERSAKPLYVGSIPTRASSFFLFCTRIGNRRV